MMKVYTQTWYRGNNYGSVLQAYALQHIITDMGYESSILNYKPTKADLWKLKFINHSLKETLQYKINEFLMKKNGASSKINNLTIFDEFREKNMQITPLCSTASEIAKVCGSDAVFVCGSDQIWNPYFYDPYYYLEFVKNRYRKIAYAPSFGVENVPRNNRKRIQKAISQFRYLSVREKRGAEIVYDLTGQHAEVTVDPTMLVTMEHWRALSISGEKEKKYLFCYFLSADPRYLKTAEEIATEKNLKILMLPMVAADFNRDGTIKKPVGPCEWLGLIENAEYVLTDSFHCTLFSIRYHKQFNVLQRFKDGDKRGQNSRIHSLLQAVEMSDRLIVPGKKANTDTISSSRFQISDNQMEKLAESSRQWFEQALHECEGAFNSNDR